MHNPSTFQVYNASAGSGKTFTLVKEYLKILLKTENIFAFQQVLAITFTNKAANEMKERVLRRLQDFSEKRDSDLLTMLSQELEMDKDVLAKRSSSVLNAILQNYSAFYITTIDSFTYKLIKSFSFDLGLSQNFDVEMNSNLLLDEAVELVVAKIGSDEDLTNLLIDYALEKSENDKSWDISRELKEFSRILVRENDGPYFKRLSEKTLSDFIQLRDTILSNQKKVISRGRDIGREGLNIIRSKNLEPSDFYYSLLPKHFDALSRGIEEAKFFNDSKLRLRIEENMFYSKSKPDHIKATIDEILSELLDLYLESEKLYKRFLLNRLTLRSVVPLAVLNEINAALETLKKENNIQLNAEFNQLISENIKEQPAPYIYERLGQKFRYFFIDEMQDTSVLQWENLLPLLGNALSQEETGLLLVGDGKQAIYRWRGGKAEQFIELGSDEADGNPFLIPKTIKELEYNFRSYDEIVRFNNEFFKHCASYVKNVSYQDLFLTRSFQKENDKKGGYVQLSFLNKMEDKEDESTKYAVKVHEIIETLDGSFSRNDICVLVRKKKEGVAIANYLSEQGVEIVSSETLLIENSPRVQFIVHFLNYISNPRNDDSLFEWVYFLSELRAAQEEKHSFILKFIGLKKEELLVELQKEGIYIDAQLLLELPLFEKVEYIIRNFHLLESSDAYVQFFVDEVVNQQRKDSTLEEFLEFWEREKNSLSIVAPENSNAVQIMTIHKSKGLEFPIVIFPCDLDIYNQIDAKVWLEELPQDDFNSFDELLVPFHKGLENISTRTQEIYRKEREKLELDNLNLLYVALTRAEEQLYIITEKVSASRKKRDNRYSDFFTNFLTDKSLYDDEKNVYSFGTKERFSESNPTTQPLTYQETYTSTAWEDHSIHMLASSSLLWGSAEGEAIDYGNLIHKMLSEVITFHDVDNVLNAYFVQGLIDRKTQNHIHSLLVNVVTHKELSMYYLPGLEIYNEREIIDVNKKIVVPDRLVCYPNKKVVILDYKTGKPSESHHMQINGYGLALESMGYTVLKKILIYINEEISVEEI